MNMNYFTTRLIKHVSVVLSFCLISFSTLNAQTFDWVSGLEGNGDDFGQSVGIDGAGNVYSGGYFFQDLDMDPGVGNNIINSNGQQDIFVSKLDANGNFLWGHGFGGDLRDRCNDIFVDQSGDMYLTGYFEDTVDFDPGVGQSVLISDGLRDIYVLKLDSNGDFLWVKRFGGSMDGEGVSIVADDDDNVYLSGLFQGTYDFDPSSGSNTLISSGNRDAFVLKLDSFGNLIWVSQFSGADNAYGMSIEIGMNGDLYLGGFYSGEVDFDPSGGSTNLTASAIFDIFALKLSPTGDLVWVRSFGDAGQDRGEGIILGENDEFYMTGRFQGTVNFDPGFSNTSLTAGGSFDGYILKLNSDGDFQWVNQVRSGFNAISFRLAKDPVDNIYATGYYSGSTDFISQSGTTSLTSGGGNEGFIQKFDNLGNEIWIHRNSGGGSIFSIDIKVADNWDVHTTGYFSGSVDFDPDGGSAVLNSLAANDAYVHKLSQTCTAPVITDVGALNTMLCPGLVDSTRVFVDGTLNDAVEWAWYEGSCGGTYLGSGDSLTVRPTVNTTYFVRPEGACGASVPCQTVVVNVDNTAPVITLTTPITVNTEPGACYYPSDSLTPPTVTDVDCGIDTVYNNADALLLTGTTTITWTAIDVNGNMSTELQEVTVQDTVSPTIAAPANITVIADASCQAAGVVLGNSASNDNCSVDTVFNDAPVAFSLGTTVVTWTVIDAYGNTNTDTQEVTVVDLTDPVIVGLPSDISVSNDAGNCSAAVSWTAPTVTDNCIGASIILTSAIPNGGPFPVGVSTVEYTATDGSGNQVTGEFTVTVTDNEIPTIAAPADLSVFANNFCTAFSVVLGSPVANDNCPGFTVTNDGPALYPLGSTTVTWTVTDAAGNSATATQNVTVSDNQDPSIVAPVDIDLTADNSCQATVSDLGSPISSDNCSVVSVTDDAPALFPLGVTVVTWTVTDGSGNTSTDTQEVTVIDETDPTISGMPADIVQSNDVGDCGAVVSWVAPTVNDNCSGAGIVQTAGPTSPGTFPVGVTTIEYTATDGSGNTATASFTISITDDENPTITAAADTIVEANNFCVAINIALDAPTVNDNCSVISVVNDAPIAYPLGNTIVTWTVTDAAGNTSTSTQNVTVADSTAPTITAPLPVTAYVDDSCEVKGVNLGTPTFSDNCAVDTVYNDAPATYTTGSYIITWVAEDASGNVSFATQNVTIIDTILPVADLTDTTIVLSPDGPITLIGSDIDLGSTDNCGLSEVVLLQEIYDCNDLGVNQIGVEVIDVHGNILNTFITVTVVESGIDLDFDMIDDACDDNVNTTVVDVPSGFTPNGDGINDLFIIPGMSDYTSIRLTIFNRYGNLVYENDQYENDWNGTSSKNEGELPDGTYFYVLELDGGERYNGYVQINRTL
jgi:gliding motility-associated-like protein